MSTGIKKSHFKYPRCQGGEMHDGEIMNLVCVDASCLNRGLICPICRMDSHDTHKIMPIKIFLEQVEEMFVGSDGGQDLNNLTDYLRSLENSRKEIQSIIKEQIISISNTFKELQVTLDDLFYSLRRSVLIQSAITTKLPSFVSLMTDQNQKDPAQIQRQFKKYCELIKYEGQKIKISDKAKKIVQGFSQIPKKVRQTIQKGSEDYKAKLKQIPLLLDKQSLQKKAQSSSVSAFSSADKAQSIILSESDTHATVTDDMSGYGFAFLVGSLTNGNKATLKLEEMASFELCIGVANVQVFRNMAFLEIDPEDKKNFEYIRCDGSTSQSTNLNQSYGSEQSLPAPNLLCFPFNQNGVLLEIEYDSKENQLKLAKKGGSQQKFTMKLGQQIKENLAKYQFVVGIGYMDKVTLIKQ